MRSRAGAIASRRHPPTGTTLVALLLALGIGAGSVAAGLALVAGLCSLARLRPSIRNPGMVEVQEDVPTLRQTR